MTTKTIKYWKTINGDFAVVPINFMGQRSIHKRALVDTGAICSVFNSEIAEELGINIYKGKPKSLRVGNGQIITVYVHKLEVIICGKRIRQAEIGFSDELNVGFNILGRKSIFDKFEICFDDKNKVVKFHY